MRNVQQNATSRNSPPNNAEALTGALRAVVLDALSSLGVTSELVPVAALDLSPKQARRLATDRGLRLVKLGRVLFFWRDEVRALAERSEVALEKPSEQPANDVHVSPRVAAAFGGRS